MLNPPTAPAGADTDEPLAVIVARLLQTVVEGVLAEDLKDAYPPKTPLRQRFRMSRITHGLWRNSPARPA